MSRCFPFPPPGYEKKSRADDENLLKKEKQKEKKHKKEKKDKEKREGKEKKDKERSEEKHKEKKDRKDKHKDKKDKHKDKERKSVSIEDTARPPEHGSVEKLGPSPVQSSETSESKFLLELGKRIGNSDYRAAEKNLLVQKFTLTGQKNAEMPGKDKGEDKRKVNGHHNGGGVANGAVQQFEGVHWKTFEGVGGLVEKSVEKRTEEENNKQKNGECGGSKHKEKDPEKKIGMGGLVEKSVKKRTEAEENNKQKNGENRGGKHKERDRGKKSKSKNKKREKEKEKEEKKKEKKKEKELKKMQLKQRETGESAADGDSMKTTSDLSNGAGYIGKRKELETNGFLHDSGIRPSKLPRPVSSTDQIVENGRRPEPCKTAIRFVADVEGNKKFSSSPSIPGNGRISEPCPRSVVPTHQIMVNGRKPEPSKTAIRIVAESGEGNKVSSCLSAAVNGKLTELCPRPKPKPAFSTNQIVDNGRKPEPGKASVHVVAEGEGNFSMVSSSLSLAGNGRKMEPLPFSQSILENGRKLEPCRSADQSASGGHVVVINHKVDSKDIKVIGKETAQQLSVSLKRPSPSCKQVKEKVKPKPPHPDSKYLSSILSVPQIEWSDFDDQEWLFGSSSSSSSSDLQQAKRPKLGSSQVEGTTKQVWAEALRVESADIIALPYVIPY